MFFNIFGHFVSFLSFLLFILLMIDYKGYRVWYDIRTALCFGIIIIITIITTLIIIMDTIVCLFLDPVRLESSI